MNEQSSAKLPSVSVILKVRSKFEKLWGLAFNSTSKPEKFNPQRTQTILKVAETSGVRLRSRGNWSFWTKVP